MAGQFKYTQESIKSILLAEPYFADISVISVDEKDLENSIEVAIAKIGICILIITPSGDVQNADTPGPFWKIDCIVQVWENMIINRASTGTGLEAVDVAEMIAATVHQKPAPGDNVFAHKRIGLSARQEQLLVYDVEFYKYGGIELDVTQAATPGLTDNAGEITLTCATVGASVFYTTDGKNPGPQTGTLYSAPFSIIVGTTVKARAWIWGYTVSQQTTYTRA